jgi:hypothetical protein
MKAQMSEKERLFISQGTVFVDTCLSMYGVRSVDDLSSIVTRPPVPLEPVIIKDFRDISEEERTRIGSQFYSEFAVAYFIVLNPEAKPVRAHALLDIAAQLADTLNTHHPILHPLEAHAEALKRFGAPDGTVKIYDLSGAGGALTSKSYSLHQDGLGNCGDVETAALYADAVPLFGGYNYFQNICRLALELARTDREAFDALFLPNALTIVRTTGKLRIKVTTPILFVGVSGRPQASYRHTDSEYVVRWRDDVDALIRARDFLLHYTRPFAYGSSFVHFTRRGHGAFNQNQMTVHGRSYYLEGDSPDQKRLLSRKWFAALAEHSNFKLAPGMRIHPHYAALYPELFGSDVLEGGWLYDPETDRNVRMHSGG